MALKNYRVELDDGTETFYQFDDDETGKAQLKAFQDAAKDGGSPVKSIGEGSPKPINGGK